MCRAKQSLFGSNKCEFVSISAHNAILVMPLHRGNLSSKIMIVGTFDRHKGCGSFPHYKEIEPFYQRGIPSINWQNDLEKVTGTF